MDTQHTQHSPSNDRKRPRPCDDEVSVLVFAPRASAPKRFKWPESLLVGAAADEAAAAFKYEAGTPTFQNKDEEVLDRTKTLKAAGVKDHARLELVDTGGGV